VGDGMWGYITCTATEKSATPKPANPAKKIIAQNHGHSLNLKKMAQNAAKTARNAPIRAK